MTEIQEADSFNSVRAYEPWAELDASKKVAALAVAADYIMANYAIRSTLTEAETARFKMAKYLLAREFSVTPPTLVASTAVQKQRDKLEGVGETETIFFDSPSDPYPMVSNMLAPLSISAGGSSSIFSGVVSI